VYDPGTADEWKACVRAAAREAMGARSVIVDAVALTVVFRMPRPKAHLDKAGNVREKFRLDSHTQKPDLDNLVKAVQDALTDVLLWRDDAQIVALTASRKWCQPGERPGCCIFIHW
jgi:Holliday junction resolvase RusA-like endonuclease